jgi:hypothetical protein
VLLLLLRAARPVPPIHKLSQTWSPMDKTNSPFGTVRRKADFLPTVFVSEKFDNAFLTQLSLCFKALIMRADRDGDASWQRLIERLRVHGLFELKVPQELVLNPLEIEVPRKGGEKQVVSYTSTEPLSFGFDTLALDLDRARVSDSVYLSEVASIYAYLFTWRLFASPAVSSADSKSDNPNPLAAATVVVLHVDSAALGEYLRTHHRGEVSAASLTKFLIGRKIEPLLNELSIFRAFDDIGARVEQRLRNGQIASPRSGS